MRRPPHLLLRAILNRIRALPLPTGSVPITLMLKLRPVLLALVSVWALSACSSAGTQTPIPGGPIMGPVRPTEIEPSATPQDTPEPTPTSGPAFQEYTVRRGDTLGLIADRFNANVDDVLKLNSLTNADVLQVGQVLRIPVLVDRVAPSDKIIPDSEAVYGPSFANFDVSTVAQKYGGYLVGYQERVEGTVMTGPQIIQLVAERFSVGPRVLLAILEMQGGWVTSAALGQTQIDYPMGIVDPSKSGLYKQAFYISSYLNEGYYGKVTGNLTTLEFQDRRRARLAPGLNPGSTAIQDAFAHDSTWDTWLNLIGPNGFLATYKKLFGDPSASAVEPLLPRDLKQPQMRLPFEDGHLWYFTGGPHAGWAAGSAWAAVDFTPKDQAGSCWTSAEWAIAAAPGRVLQAEKGRVMINLSGSGFQGSGWTLMYMHMASEDRVEIGTVLKVGDHVGHPSCEGGAAETSHLHFARLYNGQWIPAGAGPLPLVLSGWVFEGATQEYDGTMARGGQTYEANDAQVPDKNGVVADAGK
jgi:LasA protease